MHCHKEHEWNRATPQFFSAYAVTQTEPRTGHNQVMEKKGDQAVCGGPDTLTHIYTPGESLVKMLSTKGMRIKYC